MMSTFDLESIDWSELYKRLVASTARRLRYLGLHDSATMAAGLAEEWASEAICQFFDPGYKKTEVYSQQELLSDLRSRVNGLLINHRRRSSTNQENLHTADELENYKDSEPSPEQCVVLKQWSQHASDLLMERISTEENELVESVFFLHAEGLEKPAMQAAELHVPIEEIYKARRRLEIHRKAVIASMEAEDN